MKIYSALYFGPLGIHLTVVDFRARGVRKRFCMTNKGFGMFTFDFMPFFTATCFSNVAVMGSLDVRPSVCLSVTLVSSDHIH